MKLNASALRAFEVGFGHCFIQGHKSMDMDASMAWGVVCSWEKCEVILLAISTSEEAVAWVCYRPGHSEAVQFISLAPERLTQSIH